MFWALWTMDNYSWGLTQQVKEENENSFHSITPVSIQVLDTNIPSVPSSSSVSSIPISLTPISLLTQISITPVP